MTARIFICPSCGGLLATVADPHCEDHPKAHCPGWVTCRLCHLVIDPATGRSFPAKEL